MGRGRIASWLALALVLATAGCFSPKVARCAVQCAAGGSCPPDLVCMADNFCHASTEDALCGSTDDDSGIDPDDDGGQPLIDASLIDAGPPRPPIAANELIITEVMKDTMIVDDSDGEWFEITNLTGDILQLEDMTVFTGPGLGEEFTVPDPLDIMPGAHMILAVNDDSAVNGGVTVDLEYPDSVIHLNNSLDVITLISPVAPFAVLDSVEWDDTSGYPDTPGSSLSLDRNAYDDVSNNTPGNWCAGPGTFGAGDHGSPGQRNPVCP